MCNVLQIPKSTYYYRANLTGKRALTVKDKELLKEIDRIFKKNRNNCGTCKIEGVSEFTGTKASFTPSNRPINERNGTRFNLYSSPV